MNLRHQENKMVHVSGLDGTPYFMWVSIKHFDVTGDVLDSSLLADLIAHQQYHDHYAGQDPAEQDHHSLHGPYKLSAIRVGTFESSSRARAEDELREWALGSVDDPAERAHVMSTVASIFPSLVDSSIYRLPDLRSTAEHEWGSVVGSEGGFHEFVVISRDKGKLTLIVASDD